MEDFAIQMSYGLASPVEICLASSSFVRVQYTTSEPFVCLRRCGRSTCRFTDLRRKYFKQRISYYSNSCAGFNFMELCTSLSGDIHPLPGPDTSSSRIAVIH